MTNNFLKSVALISCFCLLLGGFSHQAEAKAENSKPTKASAQATNSNDAEYVKCLKEKGITMYGTSWCPHCNHQKEIFGELFSYVNYVDCDEQSEICTQKGITGYPTWLLPDGKEIAAGSIQKVAQASGCSIEGTSTSTINSSENIPAQAPTAKAQYKKAQVKNKAEQQAQPIAADPEKQAIREAYAKCLKDKNVKMYGLSHCPHCKAQKKEFGDLFQYVNYIECDKPVERCLEASKKGKGYPTWLTEDGKKIEPGSVEEVAIDAGCKVDASNVIPAKNNSSNDDVLKDIDNVQSPY
ncbi:MAG: protein disulfide isomerase family protein [Candidatus Caenarcaniphilales bacterium]|nr:protein disulfide isomerase family protein [Candidatus Caenarcaniphilales bacterium]